MARIRSVFAFAFASSDSAFATFAAFAFAFATFAAVAFSPVLNIFPKLPKQNIKNKKHFKHNYRNEITKTKLPSNLLVF